MANQIIVDGNTTADGELRFLPSGQAVLNFTLAHNERRKNPQTGEWEDGDTTFWRCALWGRRAEQWAEILTKGMTVLVTGRVKVRRFERDDGTNGLSPEITVDTLAQIPRFNRAEQQPSGGFSQPQPVQEESPWGSQPAAAGSAPF